MLSEELNTHCCFCAKAISKGAPLKSTSLLYDASLSKNMHVMIRQCSCKSQHSFCDIICAKLYNDNIEPINIDVVEYNKNISSKLVGKNAENIYLKTNGTLFKMLPTYKPDDQDIRGDISLMKKKYKAILSHIKFN